MLASKCWATYASACRTLLVTGVADPRLPPALPCSLGTCMLPCSSLAGTGLGTLPETATVQTNAYDMTWTWNVRQATPLCSKLSTLSASA